MKYLLLGILLFSLCSCEQMIDSSKAVYQFREKLQEKFPDESIGVLHKLGNGGHISIGVDDAESLSDELSPETMLVVFKDSNLELSESYIAEKIIGPIIQTSKSVFEDQVKHGQLRISKQKGLKEFSMTDSKIIEFDIEFDTE